MKRFVAVCLAAALAFACAGCGKEESSAVSEIGSANAADSSESTSSEEDESEASETSSEEDESETSSEEESSSETAEIFLSPMERMEKDAEEIETIISGYAELLKTADSESELGTLNDKAVWADDAKVDDVEKFAVMDDLFKAHQLNNSDDFFVREIDGEDYYLCVMQDDISFITKSDFDHYSQKHGLLLENDACVRFVTAVYDSGNCWNFEEIPTYDLLKNSLRNTDERSDTITLYDRLIKPRKMRDFEDDCAALGVLIKEAARYQAKNKPDYTYNGKASNDMNLTVNDLIIEFDLTKQKTEEEYFVRTIQGKKYGMKVKQWENSPDTYSIEPVEGEDHIQPNEKVSDLSVFLGRLE